MASTDFAEDELIGRSIRVEPKAVISILQRDPTLEKRAGVVEDGRAGSRGMAGVYDTVLVEGMLHIGDSVELLNQAAPSPKGDSVGLLNQAAHHPHTMIYVDHVYPASAICLGDC